VPFGVAMRRPGRADLSLQRALSPPGPEVVSGIGWTERGGVSWQSGFRTDRGPLIHRVSRLTKASRTGRNYRADCGASVPNVNMDVTFSRGNDRACPKCRQIGGIRP
jgi:hypothetical protein